jgi:uncharacterized protein (TIGR00661 family)
MKFLIPLFSPPTGSFGSLTRVLAFAETAKNRDHEIAFCASEKLADRLMDMGYQVYLSPNATLFGLPKFISDLFAKKMSQINIPVKPGKEIGNVWFLFIFAGMTNYKYLDSLVKCELLAVSDYNPDYIFTEMDLGAFIISKIKNIPIASTYASIMKKGINTRAYHKVLNAVNKIIKKYKKDKLQDLDIGKNQNILKIIPSIPELEEISNENNFIFTGNLLHSFKTNKDVTYSIDKKLKYVFVYVGTGSISQKTLETVLPQVFLKGSNTVCLVASEAVKKETQIENVIIRKYFDAEFIIPKCEWVICHAGHNTIIQSLQHNIPLIMFPGAIFERRFNAKKIQEFGAGVFAELPDFNVKWLNNILSKRDKYIQNTTALKNKIIKYNGALSAVEAIEKNKKT